MTYQCRNETHQAPGWSEWRETCAAALKVLANTPPGERSDRIRQDIYKGGIDFLMSLTGNHCAYCETLISSSPPELEHFRPKARVADAKARKEGEVHPGYWWLAYTWTNMLPACIDCNRQRRHGEEKELAGKGDRFPLADERHRAWAPEDDLRSEHPLLLDPLAPGFDWDDHVVCNEDGFFQARSEEGARTIALLGLNQRELLLEQRGIALHNARVWMENYVLALAGGRRMSSFEMNQLTRMWFGTSDFGSFTQRVLKQKLQDYERVGLKVVFPPPPPVDAAQTAANDASAPP
ncbi:hypothetical protein [Mitsuaria sp. GD03876]|uniref:hypothetical protein n=1 Tax=Mitsuaria sp. GD03876 TaxID=2975399 RepID=UPI0024479F2D|nr:hypothetical protein [Mitsuaria sp. GD03876]MDH0863494.1 hypothetical protein [Mitsuaria sp. GD03876]